MSLNFLVVVDAVDVVVDVTVVFCFLSMLLLLLLLLLILLLSDVRWVYCHSYVKPN